MPTNHIMYSPTIFSDFFTFCVERRVQVDTYEKWKTWKFEVAIPFGFSQESDKWAQPKIVI